MCVDLEDTEFLVITHVNKIIDRTLNMEVCCIRSIYIEDGGIQEIEQR